MLNFNSLLESVGLDPAKVRLVRHRHKQRYQRSVYFDAIRRHPRFEQYQAGQGNPRVISQMSSAEALASFVVDHRGDTVFAGLWQVKDSRAGHLPDPYRPPSPPGPGSTVIDLLRMTALDEYCGRIVVAWGGGERAWVQYAHRRDKPIAELRRQAEEPAFPGFGRFACGLHEVDVLPVSWSEPLRSSRGVYLLIHRSSGAQYVGSATGAEGFLGRWLGYSDGHGGNLAMKELGHAAERLRRAHPRDRRFRRDDSGRVRSGIALEREAGLPRPWSQSELTLPPGSIARRPAPKLPRVLRQLR